MTEPRTAKVPHSAGRFPLKPNRGSTLSPIGDREWESIELSVGAAVPSDIRSALAPVAGQRFVGVDANVSVSHPQGPAPNDIFVFLGSRDDGPGYSILATAESLRPLESDRRYLPFAEDAGGNYFVVCLDGPHPGRVGLIDFDYEPMSDDAVVALVASSLEGFFQSIELVPDMPA
jgi:hypothetical protein